MKSVLSIVLILASFKIHAQINSSHYYVVVGVFQKMENAIACTDRANRNNFSSNYAINPSTNTYYVYVLDSDDKANALAFLNKIKMETEHKKAWVFSGQLGNETEVSQIKDEEPVKEEPLVKEPVIKEPVKEEVVIKEPEIIQPEVKKDSIAVAEVKPDGKPFYFKLTSGATGKVVPGEARVLQAKSQEYQSFPVNKIVYIEKPKTGVLQVSTISPGYKEMKRAVNYNDPGASASEIGPQQEAIIAFPLVGVKPGDFIDFSRVQFFPNTALLQPESQTELDAIAELLQEVNYNIKIHGHSNGDKASDIISQGTSTQFFALEEAANISENASAKKLTELRAQLVADYLISKGVAQERITIKGEGGKQTIYSVKSPLASRNDRVEIEVKKGKK
jgi:outer membrane protein OmpA-like peptidoglycan-associated protein